MYILIIRVYRKFIVYNHDTSIQEKLIYVRGESSHLNNPSLTISNRLKNHLARNVEWISVTYSTWKVIQNLFWLYLIHNHENIFQLFLTFCDVIYERLRLRYFQISELNESSGCHLLDRFVFYGNTSIIKSDSPVLQWPRWSFGLDA